MSSPNSNAEKRSLEETVQSAVDKALHGDKARSKPATIRHIEQNSGTYTVGGVSLVTLLVVLGELGIIGQHQLSHDDVVTISRESAVAAVQSVTEPMRREWEELRLDLQSVRSFPFTSKDGDILRTTLQESTIAIQRLNERLSEQSATMNKLTDQVANLRVEVAKLQERTRGAMP